MGKVRQNTIGNSRLFYREAPALPLDLYFIHRELLKEIEAIPALTPLNRIFWAYFFVSSGHPDFEQYETWIGQEIIGPLNQGALARNKNSKSKLIDFGPGSALTSQIDLPNIDEISFNAIFQEELLLRREATSTYASTWRVALPWAISPSSQKNNNKMLIQLFEEDK